MPWLQEPWLQARIQLSAGPRSHIAWRLAVELFASATPEVFAAVKAGKVSVNAVAATTRSAQAIQSASR